MRRAHTGAMLGTGELLKARRAELGQTQDETASVIGVGQTRYQRWEASLVDVDRDRDLHERIRTYLGLSPEEYAIAALEHSLKVKERRLPSQ